MPPNEEVDLVLVDYSPNLDVNAQTLQAIAGERRLTVLLT